eukprot:scpid26020/ scgid2736/ Uncharacterized protein KIAA2013 homolog
MHGQFGQKAYAPVIGNGYVGVSLDDPGIWLLRNQTFDQYLPFAFLVSVTVNGQDLTPGATVIDFREGVAHRIYAPLHGQSTECWWVRQSVFVQRSAPDTIVQQVSVANKASTFLKVSLHSADSLPWPGSEIQTKSFTEKDYRTGDSDSYVIATARLHQSESDAAQLKDLEHVAITSVQPARTEVVIQPSGTAELAELVTVVMKHAANAKEIVYATHSLAKKASTRLNSIVFRQKSDVLLRSHRMAWSELWSSHISIIGLAHPNTPGNEDISAAMYYVLLSTPSFRASDQSHFRHRDHLHRDLNDTERLHCFSGPPTMHTAVLWLPPSSITAVNELIQNWRTTLIKNGCRHFVEGGAELTSQAIVLSFATVRHASHHLELALNPANVMADTVLHNVKYDRHAITMAMHTSFTGGLTRLAISANDGLAFVPGASVSSRTFSKSPVLYACPSRCGGSPHVLNSHETVLPVIVTNPPTPILYISTAEQDLLLLRQNFAHIGQAHVAVHRPIPSLRYLKYQKGVVWLGLILFIVVFHIFVIALLIVECRGQKDIDEDDGMSSFLSRRRRQLIGERLISA